MILHDNPASPFCRKVQVLARETGQMDQIELAYAVGSPTAPDKMPTAQNPLGKIPALILDDGTALYDSRVITRYLADHGSPAMVPADTPYPVLAREALADGIMDAAVLMVYEVRCRPEHERSADWVEGQWTKVIRGLDSIEGSVPAGFDLGHIALACALGYLDFRHDDRNWRGGRPNLAAWFEEVSKRDSLKATEPHV
ncbi:glutathione S-transferase N-terminal domain-containing protein [Litoreibacter roseus]|uniref:Glutathione S-transferase n=1 Tax=Litoreibacter roseus TaxID=2601869 RepID=A0A6N6JDX6_9RHOB|nr:glutathione S-transferase N-terminal domain-containing protein [Litoreibacter roseus]GFE64344.1 glutathione S-transferase [Litoreibacter roseus]